MIIALTKRILRALEPFGMSYGRNAPQKLHPRLPVTGKTVHFRGGRGALFALVNKVPIRGKLLEMIIGSGVDGGEICLLFIGNWCLLFSSLLCFLFGLLFLIASSIISLPFNASFINKLYITYFLTRSIILPVTNYFFTNFFQNFI